VGKPLEMKERSRYKKELSKRWVARGLCSNCGARPPVPHRKRCAICQEANREGTRRFRKKHPNAFKRQYHKLKKAGVCTSCRVNPAERGALCSGCSLTERQRSVRVKHEVMQKYGGRCVCCGEDRVAFLSIDHANNDGTAKRKTGEHSGGGHFYKRLRQAPVDPTLQVMCYNCNFGRRVTGVCPHQDNSYFEQALSKTPYERRKRKEK
jgi:hypothetical protein